MSKSEIELAKSICYLCPVRAQCLIDALGRADFWGVQGGYTGPERQRVLMALPAPEHVLEAMRTGRIEKVARHGR